jgi:hypothetical protein
VTVTSAGKPVLTADWGPAVSKNPYLQFKFKGAKKGDKLVFVAMARKLVPYLADAVPGWFQAVLHLYDEQGNHKQDQFAESVPEPVSALLLGAGFLALAGRVRRRAPRA